MTKIKFLLPAFLFFLLSSLTGFSQKNLTLRSQVTFPDDLSNIWGYTDSLGREYALVGTYNGTTIVEVTDPDTPVVLFNVPGPNQSIWREVATRGSYAYIASDQSGVGLLIIDLRYLPDSINTKMWTGDSTIIGQLQRIHTLRTDGNYLYLFGSNITNPQYHGDPLFIDISDPWNPHYAGRYVYPGNGNMTYVHDGYIRNDTMYSAHIYSGFFSIVNVTDKSAPQLLAAQNTPNIFTHNLWLSDDSRTLFTTDEVDYSYLAAYDVSDPTDIKFLDKIRLNNSGSVVHNTQVTNDYCVTSWYKDGVAIVDCSRPDNLIVVGNYDTSPLSGTGMDGDWGVYPYFPSGTIVASDMQEGLFVLTPDYIRGCYLEGSVVDSTCGLPVNGALIEIMDTLVISSNADLTGDFKFGTPDSGVYSIRISKAGYQTKTISNVLLDNGVVTTLNVSLKNLSTVNLTGTVKRSDNNALLNSAMVTMQSSTDLYTFTTDAFGQFSKCNIVTGNFDITVGKWGFETNCFSQVIDSSTTSISVLLTPGYFDDFTFDFGWTVNTTASNGAWERGEPVGTYFIGDADNNGTDDTIMANPEYDITDDCSDKAYVTGNGGGEVYEYDIDNGMTLLISPEFDPTIYAEPYLSYSRWFFDNYLYGGNPAPNDTLFVRLSNGADTVLIDTAVNDDTSPFNNSEWVYKSIKISEFILPSSAMKIIFEAADVPTGHWVEAAIDDFKVFSLISVTKSLVEEMVYYSLSPNPLSEIAELQIHDISGYPRDKIFLEFYDILGQEVYLPFYKTEDGFTIRRGIVSPGIYVVKIITGSNETATLKLAVE